MWTSGLVAVNCVGRLLMVQFSFNFVSMHGLQLLKRYSFISGNIGYNRRDGRCPAQKQHAMPAASASPSSQTYDEVKQQRCCISALPRTIIAKSLPRGASADCEIAALRDVRHAHAAKVERHALIVGLAVRELLKLH